MSEFELPNTRYALSGDVNIAFQVMGDGPIDIILVPGVVSHVEFLHEFPEYTGFLRRLATFARVVTFDKRGQGLSDGISGAPSLEQRVDDVRAVMDDIGSPTRRAPGIFRGLSNERIFSPRIIRRACRSFHSFRRLRQIILYGRGGVAENLGHGRSDGSRGPEPVDKSGWGQTARQIRAAFREPWHRQGVHGVVEQADRRDVDIAERARADARAHRRTDALVPIEQGTRTRSADPRCQIHRKLCPKATM